MKIRPHHLLCLPNFIGKGYDNAFAANMAQKKAQLEAEDIFTLAALCDDICAACPNRSGEWCETQEKVTRYDGAVTRALELTAGDTYSYAALQQRVAAEIFDQGRLQDICGDCEWFSLCEEIIAKTR